MNAERSAIEVRSLHKDYGDFTAVADVSFSVARGEVFCLLGPNGAGKTTTVEILEGYRSRTGGEVAVLGIDPGSGSRRLREQVGIVLQECGVQDDLTIKELVDMYGRYYPHPRSAGELIELVGLDAKAGTRAKDLSGGQRRRLDLALALVGDPELIFLDEPTTGFDPQARRQAWDTVKALCELGKTILLTTHYMDEAQALASRIAILAGGRIIAEGSPDELGGRNRRPAEISFRLPPDVGPDQLPSFGATVQTQPDGKLLLITEQPVQVTNRLTGWALEHQVALDSFAVAQPTLEDVYLELTRDASSTVEVQR